MAKLNLPADDFSTEHHDLLKATTVKVMALASLATPTKPEEKQTGSGVVIKTTSTGAFVLTCFHVTLFTPTIFVQLEIRKGELLLTAEHVWSIFSADESAHDLALYFCASTTAFVDTVCPTISALAQRPGQALIGREFLSRGYPLGRQASTTGEIIEWTPWHQSHAIIDGPHTFVEECFTAKAIGHMRPGWSGGPCILEDGSLVGILSTGDSHDPIVHDPNERLHFVPVQAIRSFLEAGYRVYDKCVTWDKQRKEVAHDGNRILAKNLRSRHLIYEVQCN